MMTRTGLLAVCLSTAALLWWPDSTLSGGTRAQPGDAGDRVILITLDGTRLEEMFGGLDASILKSTLKEGQAMEATGTFKRFWADTPEKRREKLMPFLWGTLLSAHGSIAGDRAQGSRVSLTNTHWFSYPGYAEILLGEAHDDVITSNDPVQNPYPTVLETLRERLSLPRESVATFASWGVFNAIVEHTAGATTVDAGPGEAMPADARLREWAGLQQETLPPWSDVRSDIFTFKFAMAHLEAARPRVVYLAFDETDDWAHDGRYDRLLDAYARTDRYLEELWTWLQRQPDYRGRTHLLLTTDHGRGRTVSDWRDHGAKITGADAVWIAFVSPRMSARGPWRSHAPLTTSQIAATLAGWMGVDWRAVRPSAGLAIEQTQGQRR